MYTHLAAVGSGTASLDWHVFRWGLIGGAIAAVLAWVWFALARIGGWGEMALPAAGQWKLSDSWASNITAIITALAAVAAIFSDDLKDVFDHRAPLVFALTTAVMLVFAALAPVGYAVLQRYQPQENQVSHVEGRMPLGYQPRKNQGFGVEVSADVQKDGGRISADGGDGEEFTGTWTGWCLAASITLFAVDGSLAAAIGVVHDLHFASSRVMRLADAVIVVIALLLLGYAIRTYELLRKVSKTDGSVKKLTGIVTISCCGSDSGLTRTRMTML
jgi:hypothetical protein